MIRTKFRSVALMKVTGLEENAGTGRDGNPYVSHTAYFSQDDGCIGTLRVIPEMYALLEKGKTYSFIVETTENLFNGRAQMYPKIVAFSQSK